MPKDYASLNDLKLNLLGEELNDLGRQWSELNKEQCGLLTGVKFLWGKYQDETSRQERLKEISATQLNINKRIREIKLEIFQLEHEEDNVESRPVHWKFPSKTSTSINDLGISRNAVINAFKVRANDNDNFKFWDDKLGRPPKWLKDARLITGKPGTKLTRWDPIEIAVQLFDRGHMTLNKLDAIIENQFKPLVDRWNDKKQYLK